MKPKSGHVRRAAGLNAHSLISRGILALIGLLLLVFLVSSNDLVTSKAQNSLPPDDIQPLSPGVGDGVLDNTFGTGGKVSTSFNTTGNRENRAFDGALQPDGKIIAVGFAHSDGANNGGHDFAVARYNADGTPDSGFGPIGQRLVHFDQVVAGAADDAFAVALQTDNKIVVAGSAGITINVASPSQVLCQRSWALARFNTDGTLDSSFGTNGNGRVQTPYLGPTPPFPAPCPDTNTITDIAIQPDGKIVAVGWTSESTGENMLIGRYNTNGTLDNTFGSGGFRVIDFFAVNTTDRLEAVSLQSDGKIVAVGSARTASSPFDFAVVRLNFDGSPDNTFGTSGRASFGFSNTFDEFASGVIVLPDGRIVVAGTSLINFNIQTFTLLRLSSGGALDTTFATNGRTVQQIGTGTSFCTSVALQHDGKLVAFGNAETNVREFALARYTVGGLLDSTFGTGGVVITDMAGPNGSPDTIESGMIQPDGKIVGVGTVNGTQLPNFPHFGVARYGNTAPTTTHTISGTVTGAFNVSIALTGSQSQTTLTDRFGFYSFRSVPAGGSYTVTPSKQGTTFNPTNRTFNNLSSNQTAADFAATSSTLVIKGTIRDSGGIGIGDLTVNLTGSASLQTTTDSAGQYAFPGLVAGSYTVTPAATPNFNFNPANRVFNSVNSDQTGDFAATTNLPPATNGRIVFDGHSSADIYTVNPDGSGLARITNDPGRDAGPVWSPDGKKIAFFSTRTNVADIYVMNPDGSNQTRITQGFCNILPAWSPDGSKIAFSKYEEPPGFGSFGRLSIYTMNADGSNPTRLSSATNLKRYDLSKDWSPDGSKIVFERVVDVDSAVPYQIFVMNSDGSNETQLTTGSAPSQSPKWSPDGSKIVFARSGQIFVMNANGSNLTQLTSSSSNAVPDWSPDGSKIVFQRGSALFTMNADGTNPTEVAKVSTFYGPSWGPQAAVATPTGANVNAQLGNVTVTYSNVNTAGTTTINPIDPTSVQPLPAGYATIAGTGMAYNITTTAVVTPPITTCFKVPAITNQTVFNSLRVLHGEGGALVDRTILSPGSPAPDFATKTICASTTTLSPFVIAQKIDPNLLTIQGLVVDSNNLPLSEVTVSLGGDQTLTTQTDIDGRFLFVNLFVGSDYTVTPSAGGFNFIPQNKSFQDLLLDQSEVFVGSAVPPLPLGRLSLIAGDISVSESAGVVEIPVFNFGGNPGTISVNYSSSDTAGSNACSVVNGAASSRCDYSTSVGTLNFAAGETIKTISVLIIDDSYADGTETLTLQLSNPTGALLESPSSITVTITDNDGVTGANPIEQAQFFVDEHYVDFLGRLSDPSGRAFWTNEIASCGSNQACLEVKRINVSAAFFLSIEFQETGYFLERAYKSSFGDASGTSTFGGTHQLPVPIIRLNEFQADKQIVGRGVIVGQAGWEQVLENNKQAFLNEFVQRSRFTTAFPNSMTAAQFVDALNANAGNPLSQAERDQLVNDLATSAKTRAQVLRAVVEDAQLVAAEFNRAFVLAQYFGYLRRNPNDTPDSDYTGFDFWLIKLNQFNGNFVNAEMVKAFITSGEYRQRFGP